MIRNAIDRWHCGSFPFFLQDSCKKKEKLVALIHEGAGKPLAGIPPGRMQ